MVPLRMSNENIWGESDGIVTLSTEMVLQATPVTPTALLLLPTRGLPDE